ncbi:Protein AE7-like 1 [Asimina triloba]
MEIVVRDRESEMTLGLINANPCVHAKKERVARSEDHHPPHSHLTHGHDDDGAGAGAAAVDPLEEHIHFVRDIRDPEHPYSLEQLSVLSEESITVDEKLRRILITFTPTIQHCSMATVIGLCLRVKLMRCFPPHFKIGMIGALVSDGISLTEMTTADATFESSMAFLDFYTVQIGGGESSKLD